MELQKRIKDLIEDCDLTQKKLAKQLDITESTMSGYMTGLVRMPAWMIEKCALYFEVSTDYLYGMTDVPQPVLELSPVERKLVLDLRTLTRDQRELILRNVAIMREQNEK